MLNHYTMARTDFKSWNSYRPDHLFLSSIIYCALSIILILFIPLFVSSELTNVWNVDPPGKLASIIMLGSKKGVFFASDTHSNLFQITAFKVRNHGVASKMHFQLYCFFSSAPPNQCLTLPPSSWMNLKRESQLSNHKRLF